MQEEIRFSVCPELVVSMLFTAFLKDNETLILKGAEQFSEYKGYASTLEFAGDHRDSTEIIDGIMDTSVIAMDAVHFLNPNQQFEERWIVRELNKSYCGFYLDKDDVRPPKAIATGSKPKISKQSFFYFFETLWIFLNFSIDWGCGVFNGNKQLKFLIQLISASACDRSLKYYTFGDERLSHQLEGMSNLLRSHEITVGKLVGIIVKYGNSERKTDLFEWIVSKLEGSGSSKLKCTIS